MTLQSTKPLDGVRVFLSRDSDSPMTRALEAAGAQVAASPLCHYTARAYDELATSMERLERGEYSWLCLSSPRTLAMISEAGFNVPAVLSAAVEAGTRIAVVGPATAVSVFDVGQRAHLTAGDPPSSAALVESFSRFVVTDEKPILIPCASIAKKTLPEGLSALGWQVEVLHVYDTDAASELPEVMSAAFDEPSQSTPTPSLRGVSATKQSPVHYRDTTTRDYFAVRSLRSLTATSSLHPLASKLPRASVPRCSPAMTGENSNDMVNIFLVTSGSVARAASALLEAHGIARPPAVALGEPSASMLRQLDWDTYGICPSAQMPDIIDTLAQASEKIRAAAH